MRGRSPFNKYKYRKQELLKILLKLDREARWKTLKENLKNLKWGPTTLKKVLDKMIEEGTLKREARLSKKGPEVWYILTERKKGTTKTMSLQRARLMYTSIQCFERILDDFQSGTEEYTRINDSVDLSAIKELLEGVGDSFSHEKLKGYLILQLNGKIGGIEIKSLLPAHDVKRGKKFGIP